MASTDTAHIHHHRPHHLWTGLSLTRHRSSQVKIFIKNIFLYIFVSPHGDLKLKIYLNETVHINVYIDCFLSTDSPESLQFHHRLGGDLPHTTTESSLIPDDFQHKINEFRTGLLVTDPRTNFYKFPRDRPHQRRNTERRQGGYFAEKGEEKSAFLPSPFSVKISL